MFTLALVESDMIDVHVLISHLLGSGTPLIAVVVMAVLTAINPCPLATVISSLLYLSRGKVSEVQVWSRVLMYGLGRMLLYIFLGVLSSFLLRTSITMLHLQEHILYTLEHYLGWILILFGFLFGIFGREHRHTHEESSPVEMLPQEGQAGSFWRSLLLGMTTALFFCPATGVIYFGFMIPLVAQQTTYGVWMLLLYSLLTASVVVPVYGIMRLGLSRLEHLAGSISRTRRLLNWVVSGLFIGLGILLVVLHMLEGHPHH